MTSSIVVVPKRHVVWAIKSENRSSGSTWAQDREKRKEQDRTRQDRTVKKFTKALYFTYLARSLHWTDFHKKIAQSFSVRDVITCAKFWANIFRGYDSTGVEFPVFLLILSWALQQCSATALPVIGCRAICKNALHCIKLEVPRKKFLGYKWGWLTLRTKSITR